MNDTIAEQSYPVATADSAVARLVQITDCHIFAAAEERLQNMNTRKSLSAVSQALVREQNKPDMLLATGDLSQDGSVESYQYLATVFDDLGLPTFWLPGNHDDNTNMATHLTGQAIHAHKHILVGNWQVVLLDSTVEGEIHGRVSSSELEFLDSALRSCSDRHALVCLHHQARDSGSEWLDLKGLKNSAELGKSLIGHDNVRAVLWGHVHQDSTSTIDNILWMSTPSSCIQFKPNSKDFAVGDEAPGYRTLSLYPDGNIETLVRRVEPGDFT